MSANTNQQDSRSPNVPKFYGVGRVWKQERECQEGTNRIKMGPESIREQERSDIHPGPVIQLAALVTRQNFRRDPTRVVLGRVGLNTIIASAQHEDSGGHEPECAWSAHI